MKTNKKIQAFTLSELLVVLVISSIVVTLSFLALGNVQNQVRTVTKTFEKQQRIIQLERLLAMDFSKSTASFDKQNMVVVFTNSEEVTNYKFASKSIVRVKDTIDLAVEKIEFYLDGNKVTSGKVDAIEILFASTYSQQRFFVYQRKDASFYIN